jgi:hypothetical protein
LKNQAGKYLKDQFELKHKTNLLQKLRQANLVLFEPKVSYPLKLSLETLERDDVYELKKKVALRQKTGRKSSLPVAEKIAEDQLLAETEDEIFINLEELRNGFVASGITSIVLL